LGGRVQGLPSAPVQIARKLNLQKIPFEREKRIQIIYKGSIVGWARIDLLVAGKLVVEVESVATLGPVDQLQTLRYVRLIKQPLGPLINFNVVLLKQGIKRIIDTDQEV
jgi:GxxExxY protein